ncbi:AAA family ATPase [Rhodoferax aquaticus]|uniref:DNA transposition protein n=1 Tax=Rhodoferax aquaticus TaxID=2527691 RepID=A0A515EKC7_9BURK|nr:AAA family ATPase [Rhodoferax aquaticus]QDL53123.1 DNA transposition protein [Rhodoferax aquaticus]
MSTPAINQTALPGMPAAGAYSEQDRTKVKEVLKWLNDAGKSRAWLSKKSNIPGGTLSQILSGKYVSSPTRQLNQMLAVLEVEGDRMRDGTPGYIKGSVHDLMCLVMDRTRKHQNFGVVTGYVGIGKSRCCREYRETHPMTLLVEVSPNMTPGVLMTELLGQLNNAVPAGLNLKFQELVRVLRGTNYVVIADEAEKMSSAALEHLRRLRDMAQVGVVLVGTEKLTNLIKPQHGQFDQIRSRVGMWPKTIERISRDDADDMARIALADAGDLSNEVLETLWAYADGSARVLNENLIPAIKDYGMGKLPLSRALIEAIAAKVLFMSKPRYEGDK